MDFSNSFYYFFSATPQVLGAILGLFGVLVIFKMQSVKNNLIGIAQAVLNTLKYEIKYGDSSNEALYIDISRSIQTSLYLNDLKGIEETINKIEVKNLTSDDIKESIDGIKKVYSKERKIIDDLISATISISIETVALIIVCLTAIPLGEFILKFPTVLIFIFVLVIIDTIHDLWGFIKLMRVTLGTWALI